jgi:AcrR family transcriptional regulator
MANRDRVLEAAARVVKRAGTGVALAAIAREAGVGIGTLYRHYPSREDLLAALNRRALGLVLEQARKASHTDAPAITCLGIFFEATIAHRDELVVLPLHGGPMPVSLTEEIAALRKGIRSEIEAILQSGQQDETIRGDVTPKDIIVTGALLAQPLRHYPDWVRTARRQAQISLDGLAAPGATPLPGRRRPRTKKPKAGSADGPPGDLH